MKGEFIIKNTIATIFVVLIVVGMIALITNPNKDIFNTWLVEKVKEQALKENPSQLEIKISDFIAKYLGKNIVDSSTTHYNYRFYSIFEVDLFGKKVSFLGIFNSFFKLPY